MAIWKGTGDYGHPLHMCANCGYSHLKENYTFLPMEKIARPDNKFAYAGFERSEMPSQLECDVKLETLSELAGETKVCHLKLDSKDRDNVKGRVIILQLDLFGNNKVLVTELDHDGGRIIYLKLTVLNMNNC